MQAVEVQPLSGYRLHLRYADGVAGDVDLSRLSARASFACGTIRKRFDECRLDAGEVRWNDEVDLCADALYMEITGKTPEEMFPSIGRRRSMPEISRFYGIVIKMFHNDHQPLISTRNTAVADACRYRDACDDRRKLRPVLRFGDGVGSEHQRIARHRTRLDQESLDESIRCRNEDNDLRQPYRVNVRSATSDSHEGGPSIGATRIE